MGWSRFFRRAQWDEERAKELEAHLAHERDDNIARGLSLDEATRAAYRKLGNPTRIREDIYTLNTIPILDTLWQDLRYAVRSFRRAPVFAMTAILSLALGIGATTSVFSLINSLLLRELPVNDPHRLATISSATAIDRGLLAGGGWNYPMWERFRDRAQAFDGAFVWMPRRLGLGQGGEAQWVEGLVTTSDFFSTLGVRAALGRTFISSDGDHRSVADFHPQAKAGSRENARRPLAGVGAGRAGVAGAHRVRP